MSHRVVFSAVLLRMAWVLFVTRHTLKQIITNGTGVCYPLYAQSADQLFCSSPASLET